VICGGEYKVNIAILSDIHGNHVALKRCIDYAVSRNVNAFIFLGDYVGELAYPEKTMKMIYDIVNKYKCYFIKGNKEDYWINYKDVGESGWFDYNSTTGALLYTYKHLSERDIEFFRGLQISKNINIDDMPQITICHGSPYKVNEKLLPNSDRTFEIIDSIDTSIIICGHTHIQSKIQHNGKIMLNAGSVGVPLHSSGKSQFLIMHEEGKVWREEFITIEYDIEKVIDELHSSKLYEHAHYWCVVTENLLRKGNISHGTVLSRAISLCNTEEGNCVWPSIPEKYWKKAIEEIIDK
jgi:putative phosphoesterase